MNPGLDRRSCGPAQLLQTPVQLIREVVVRRSCRPRECADHEHATRRKPSFSRPKTFSDEVAQPPLHQVAGDRVADGLGHHEADALLVDNAQVGGFHGRCVQMDHHQGPTAAPSPAHDLPEVDR